MEKGNMRVYGCGGCGINIASYYLGAAEEEGSAQIFTSFIDTSRSNINSMRGNLRPEQVFVMDNMDGSGKIRSEHDQEIADNIKRIVLDHRPMDFNVVVFSASGGSGSVIGPLLMAELLNRGVPAVAMVVGSDESEITAVNALNTLKSLEQLAKNQSTPFVMCYEHNQRGVSLNDVDRNIHRNISSLAILASKQNTALDSQDVINWLNFSKSTTVSPRLALLQIFNDNTEAESVSQPISVASLRTDRDQPQLSIRPDYYCDGFMSTVISGVQTFHFVISTEGVHRIAKNLNDTISEMKEIRNSRVDNDSLVGNDDRPGSSGLIT